MKSMKFSTSKPSLRIVHTWIFNPQGRLLICKRPAKAHVFPGVWTSSAGGHVEDGEEYKEAASRETLEELGITVDVEHAFLLPYDHGTHCNLIDLWVSHHSGKGLVPDKNEIAEMRFVSLEELKKEIGNNPKEFSPEFVKLVEKVGRTAWAFDNYSKVNIYGKA